MERLHRSQDRYQKTVSKPLASAGPNFTSKRRGLHKVTCRSLACSDTLYLVTPGTH